MKKNERWVIGNNGVDLHVADETMAEVATFFDKKRVKLAAAAPDMLDVLQKLRGIEVWIADREMKELFQNIVYPVIDKATK